MANTNDVLLFLEEEDNKLRKHCRGLVHAGRRLADEGGGELYALLISSGMKETEKSVAGQGVNQLLHYRSKVAGCYRAQTFDP